MTNIINTIEEDVWLSEIKKPTSNICPKCGISLDTDKVFGYVCREDGCPTLLKIKS